MQPGFSMLSLEQRRGTLALVSACAALSLLCVGPIAQDPDYHLFADSRRIAGISNFWNVVSNLPFVLVGVIGLLRQSRLTHLESTRAYLVICVGVVMVGFGSACYHYAPTNQTLLWDRLPMTVAFMALMALLLGERVLSEPRPGLLWSLIAVGAGAALYWSYTESLGRGDLRPYVLVQFLPVLLIPLVLALFPQRYLRNSYLVAAFGCYFAAKILEHFDGQVFAVTGLMSGHALKHLAAAAAVLCIILAVPTQASSRKPEPM
jgi:predicted membrane channel-forming protein YqfA (hemolysin III family)